MLANIRASLDRPKPSRKILPDFEKPPEFKDIVAQAGTKKLADKAGFGGGLSIAPQKSKKKKK